MSINLLEIAESTLGPILLSKASDLFGFNQEQGKNALSSVLPTLLSGVLNKASTNSGASALYNAIADNSIDSHIGNNLTGLLGNPNNVSKLTEQGGKILGFLFGDKAKGLGEHVANIAGTPAAGTSSLLTLAAPAIFGLLKNQIIGNKLSPHGFTSLLSSQAVHLEKSLPETVLEWLGWGSLAGFFGGLSTKFTGALSGLSNLFDDDDKKPAMNHHSSNNNKKGGGFWKWLVPLALLALAAILFKSCQKGDEMKPAEKPVEAAMPAPAATPAPSTDSTLQLTFNNGKTVVNAIVATDADKTELLKHLEATYGKDNVTADIKVDASVKPSGWLAKLADVLKLAKTPGAELNIKGSDVILSGALANPKLDLVNKLKGLLVGMNVTASAFDSQAAIADAGTKFSEAVTALVASGKCDSDALVNAMGLYVVNFASASADIPTKDIEALKTAVPAMAACAKEGVKIEVGGHTDNVGNTAANVKLSEARANSLKALFVKAGIPTDAINVKGFGDSNPIGDNNTEEGRFKNRRITYTKQ